LSVEELELGEVVDLVRRERRLAEDVLRRVHPRDLPHVLLRLPPGDRRRVISLLPEDAVRSLLVEAPSELVVEALEAIGVEEVARHIASLPLDEACDVLRKLPPHERRVVAERLPEGFRGELEPLLAHSMDTVGALMVTKVPAFNGRLRVGEAVEEFIARVRAGDYYTDHYVYVVDDGGRLIGYLSSSELMASPREARLAEVARRPVKTVSPSASREEAAMIMARYDLMELPVVDEHGRLLGVVVFDDAADVLLDRHAGDLERFGGFTREVKAPYLAARVKTLIEKRALCLIALCLLEALTVNVISMFERVISAVVALSFFIPLLCDIGGNSGSQTASFVIRSLATGDVDVHDALRVAAKEAAVSLGLGSLGLGLILSPVLFALGYAITRSLQVATLLAVVVVVVVFVASMVGGLLPLISAKLGLDPAASSAPLITTIVLPSVA